MGGVAQAEMGLWDDGRGTWRVPALSWPMRKAGWLARRIEVVVVGKKDGPSGFVIMVPVS